MTRIFLPSSCALALASGAFAHPTHGTHQEGAILSSAGPSKTAAFEILAAHARWEADLVTFHMTTKGVAGADQPTPAGELGGAPVLSYVWPTSLDPATVGFESGTGILALAVTSHPDFDDTPLFDENGDGDLENDGGLWHSHWIVLTPTDACGERTLGVRDIPEGETPAMPMTWPGLPIFIDSPGYTPIFDGPEISVTVPFANTDAVRGAAYYGVTAALRVNASIHAPLLCVTDILDVASEDLSQPSVLD